MLYTVLNKSNLRNISMKYNYIIFKIYPVLYFTFDRLYIFTDIMKLSVTSFRAHSSAQKKILKYQNHLNYVTTHLPVVPNINASSSTVSSYLFFAFTLCIKLLYRY